MNPPITLEITSDTSRVRVKGKRSTKGWDIIQVKGASATPLGHRKAKADAIQYALDACEPGSHGTYLVRPA